jgi:hypothetical protein
MNEDIQREIERSLRERGRLRIERHAPQDVSPERELARLDAHVKTVAGRHLATMFDEEDAREAQAFPLQRDADFAGFKTQRQVTKHTLAYLRDTLAERPAISAYKVPRGSRIFSPPYDTDWGVGAAQAFFARLDGHVTSVSVPNGLSAGGVGFFLTTNEPALVSIVPFGEYNWTWIAFANLPFARTRGGMGITIYTDGNPDPTQSREQVLWDASGFQTFHGASGRGAIADAASPAFGFGTVPLAPALLNMVPGSHYLVWIWCWQTCAGLKEDDPYIGFMNFEMPAVSIDAGAPLVIR